MKQTTRWVTFGGLLTIALFDVWAIAAGGVDASVSQFITDCSASPRIAFVCGCLVTHWFGWVMIPVLGVRPIMASRCRSFFVSQAERLVD